MLASSALTLKILHLSRQAVEQLEDIHLLAALNTLGDRRLWIQNDTCLWHSDRRVSTVFILNDNPLHSQFLYEGVTENNSQALELASLVRLENVCLQDRANRTELPGRGLVFPLRVFVAEVCLNDGTLIAQTFLVRFSRPHYLLVVLVRHLLLRRFGGRTTNKDASGDA
jgi:hypothetical protein